MKEQKWMQALAYVDDAYLLETERALHQKKKRKLGLGRKAAALIAAVLVLTLTVSATYLAVHWDDTFVRLFSPNEAVLAQTEDGIQNLSVLSQCGDVTLNIQQSLGDTTTLYFRLDVILPESQSVMDFAMWDEESQSYLPTIMPANVEVYYCMSSYAEIKGMSPEKAAAYLEKPGTSFSGSIGIRTEGVDEETNTLSYLIELGMDEERLDRKHGALTLLVGSLCDVETDAVQINGPFLISWKAENRGEIQHYEIYDGAKQVGKVLLSGFSLRVTLDASEYTVCDDLMDAVSIVYQDGRTESPAGACYGSIVLPGGRIELDWQFDQIQVLDEVNAIEIAGYTCKAAVKPN